MKEMLQFKSVSVVLGPFSEESTFSDWNGVCVQKLDVVI